MSEPRISIHGQWSSKLAFIFAATGSAVGLGNIWKFPYITGENGGGAFVLVYIICVATVALPIMIAEVLLGKRGKRNPVGTLHILSKEENLSTNWKLIGFGGILAGVIILSYYSVIAGWALAYVVRAASGFFSYITKDGATEIFSQLVSTPEVLLAWHTLFMVMTGTVVARGVRSGLESAVTYLMPSLFVLLLALVAFSALKGNFQQAVDFLFTPDFEKLTPDIILLAMGQAFFSLSLGMGAIMVYGSYLQEETSIVNTSCTVATLDTLVALVAGLAIFPIVFASGLELSQGPSLVFQSLTIAFGQMPGGTLFGVLFFVLLVFAAWTSSISLLEPVVTWLIEQYSFSRNVACLISCLVIWSLGIGTIFSFNIASEYTFLGRTFFENLDYLASNILLPLGGAFMSIFVGWRISRSSVVEELSIGSGIVFHILLLLIRFVAPAAVFIIFFRAVGIL
jgi:NSS family neurotransmitter:Na+ symporter